MTKRDLAIARAAVDAAATICNRQHHRMDLPGDYRYAAGVCELHIREIDLPSIVAGVGEDAEVAALRARVAELEGLLLRYRNEVPLGHQPHMIANLVDAAMREGK